MSRLNLSNEPFLMVSYLWHSVRKCTLSLTHSLPLLQCPHSLSLSLALTLTLSLTLSFRSSLSFSPGASWQPTNDSRGHCRILDDEAGQGVETESRVERRMEHLIEM